MLTRDPATQEWYAFAVHAASVAASVNVAAVITKDTYIKWMEPKIKLWKQQYACSEEDLLQLQEQAAGAKEEAKEGDNQEGAQKEGHQEGEGDALEGEGAEASEEAKATGSEPPASQEAEAGDGP